MTHVSALMSTYAGDNAKWLADALESVFTQTRPLDQLVLVVDGPIGDVHNEVIMGYENDSRVPVINVIRMPQNKGLAEAMNVGLKACSGDWIMRVDSDDICRADRLAIQLDCADKHPDADIFSSWCEEFSDETNVTRIKASAIQHEAVIRALHWRNVVIHQTNMIRARTLRSVGGYRSKFGKMEDYDLYVRLALAGARFRVIPAELVSVRTNNALIGRRGGWDYLVNEIRFRIFCLRSRFLTIHEFLLITTAFVIFRVIGVNARGWLYRLARTAKA
jgi:GT2 family glycosyltransferase